MHTVLFVQTSLQPPGGGNGLAAWMIEALRSEYAITLFTWRPVDVDAINRYWGTSLAAHEIEVLTVPPLVRSMVDLFPLPLGLLRASLVFRFARPFMSKPDLVVSASNEANFERPGIQYIHYPTYKRPRPRVDMRWYHSPGGLLSAYYWFCDRIGGVTAAGIRQNLTLANSDWTGAHFQREYGTPARTVYPPVTGLFPDVPWERRQNGFVCLGRIAPEKDIDAIIDVVAAVRHVHPDTHLHVIGSPGHRRYYRRIRRRVSQNRDWITLHIDISHDEVRRLITSNRYGLHAMENEHFGMAPAEMATGGCIVWVRDDGGQVEIVDGDQRLIFHSPDDAIAKILRTMGSPAEQHSLREILAARIPQFSASRFVEGVRAAAEEQLARQEQLRRQGTLVSAMPRSAG